MKFTYSWLKEHLETEKTPKEIIEVLEKIGFPCEKTTFIHESLKEIKIAKIIEKNTHPNADKLNLYTILFENEEKVIVCGDQSLNKGDYVPYAKPGTTIPKGEFKIKTTKIRGIESPGMLCSADELLLPIEQPGVLRCFEEDHDKSIASAYEDQAIIEIEVTPNRGDMLAVRGIARTLSFFNAGKLKELKTRKIKCKEENLIEIESSECSAIACLKVKHKIKQTNSEIAKKMQLTGNSLTNIDVIDLTNFIAHELGQPMHAFDNDKLKGNLSVRNLEKQEKFKALNEKEIELEKNTLIISDSEKIVSWPGVIGAENSKIENNSENILFETGIFKINSLQRRKNKIQTTSAKKFECGVDYNNLLTALERMLYLLNPEEEKSYQHHKFKETKKIEFNLNLTKTIIGKMLTKEEFKAKLEPRGFIIKEIKENLFEITPPSYNFFGIKGENCIIEELAIDEYENMESKLLPEKKYRNENKGQNEKELFEKELTQSAINNGFFEIYNFSLSAKEEIEQYEVNIKQITVNNASNINYSYLRSNLITGLLKTASWHKNNNYHYSNFFEQGIVYGNFENTNQKFEKQIFSAIANNAEYLQKLWQTFLEKNNKIEPKIETLNDNWFEDGITYKIDETIIAKLGMLKQSLTKKYGLEKYFAIEIETEKLNQLSEKKYEKPSKQSPIYKDISFKMPANIYLNQLIEFLKSKKYAFEVFDAYPSTKLNVPKNIGIRFMFLEDKILTTEEINKKIEKIKKITKDTLNIES